MAGKEACAQLPAECAEPESSRDLSLRGEETAVSKVGSPSHECRLHPALGLTDKWVLLLLPNQSPSKAGMRCGTWHSYYIV